ncbi:hypothetical protein KAR91_56935 [Candidatus Pacearchaeota archaeon]|nr:hypothetical protein [Candidatus Pacearchaeota archaeon]
MSIVTNGLGGRGAIVTHGYGDRYISMLEIIGARYGMFFETIYEKWYILLAYYIKRELEELQLQSEKHVFKEVEIGDTENIEGVPGAYIFFAPVNIAENYVGPRSTTHMFTYSIMIRMPQAQTPLDLFKNIARYHGLIYNRLIGDRSMNDNVIMDLVNEELETTETPPLCQHRAIGGWRPPVGGKAPEIFFDLAIEKRMR